MRMQKYVFGPSDRIMEAFTAHATDAVCVISCAAAIMRIAQCRRWLMRAVVVAVDLPC